MASKEVDFVRDWTRVVRRARLGRTVKSVAIALATYADPDGTRVYPGIARLSWECELSYSTVKASLRTLRLFGLIRKVGQRGDADMYVLSFHEALFERVDIPTPTEADRAIEEIRRRYKGSYDPSLRSARKTAEIDGDDGVQSGAQTAELHDPKESAVGGSTTREESAVGRSTSLQSGAQTATYQDGPLKSTSHSSGDQIADVLVPETSGRNEEMISNVDDLAKRPRCPHGRSTRRDNGIPRCVDCRTEAHRITAEAVSVRPGPSKCAEHKLPIAKCNFCRRGLPGARPPSELENPA